MKMKRNTVLTNVCHDLWVQVVEVKELCEKELRLRAEPCNTLLKRTFGTKLYEMDQKMDIL